MSVLHLRNTSDSRTAFDILALHADMMSPLWEKNSQPEQKSLVHRRCDWRGAAAVDSQGWVCVNVMTWLLGWRIHRWWQRCSDEVVLLLHHEIMRQPMHHVISCRDQTDWSISSWLLVQLLQTAARPRPRPRPKPMFWGRGQTFGLKATLASRT